MICGILCSRESQGVRPSVGDVTVHPTPEDEKAGGCAMRVAPVNGSGKVVARIAPNEEEGCENRILEETHKPHGDRSHGPCYATYCQEKSPAAQSSTGLRSCKVTAVETTN